MSLPSLHNDGTSANTDTKQFLNRSIRLWLSALARPLEAVAFWSAIALPFLYLPILVSGLESTAQLTAFLALLALHTVAIVSGHRYNRE